MKLSRVAPELRTPVRRVPPLAVGSASMRWLLRASLRLLPAAKLQGVTVERIRHHNIKMRLIRPANHTCNGALYWIHGGGFVIGQASQDDALCAQIASELGILVVSVDYRLAPEHPFPAPLDDCLTGWRWLQASAHSLDVDPTRIAIGGESAGGGLAANLIQKLHDSTDDQQAAAQFLICPMLDDRTAVRRDLDSLKHWVWTNRNNADGWRAFLAQAPGAPDLPPYAAAARRDNLKGLPPAWIGVGDIDLFHDEDCAYADRLRDAGVETELSIVEGAPHGFESWARTTNISQIFLTGGMTWLKQQLTR